MVNKKHTVISSFAGGGGSILGYKWAGFTDLLAIEFDNNAVETLKLNYPKLKIYHGDIKNLSGKECLNLARIKRGELDIFDGSPPCQGFSTAGKRQVSDRRNDLFKEYIRLVIELQPKVFVMENVSGMIKGKMKGKYLQIWNELNNIGYSVKSKLMNAMWYEVPQSRERLFFIGVRNDLQKEPVFPEPLKKYITFEEATKDIANYSDREFPDILLRIGKYQPKDKWSSIPEIYEEIKGNLAGCISTKWAISDKVIGSIPKSEISITGIVHPNRQRYLNLDELKVCSSFPVNYKFTDRNHGNMRIGNAVMPKMMYYIAKTIKETILI